MMKEKEEKDFMKIKKYVLAILFVSLLFIFSISFNNKSYASLYLNNLNLLSIQHNNLIRLMPGYYVVKKFLNLFKMD